MADQTTLDNEHVDTEEFEEEGPATISIPGTREGVARFSEVASRVGDRARQGSMLAIHPEMDEHAAIVQKTVRDLAGKFPEGAEISLGVKVPYELITKEGELMDAKISIKVDVKPKKEEK